MSIDFDSPSYISFHVSMLRHPYEMALLDRCYILVKPLSHLAEYFSDCLR